MNDIIKKKLEKAYYQNIIVYNSNDAELGTISKTLISLILGVAQRQFRRATKITCVYTDTEQDVLFDLFYDNSIELPFKHELVLGLQKTYTNEIGGSSYRNRPILLAEFDSNDVLLGCY